MGTYDGLCMARGCASLFKLSCFKEFETVRMRDALDMLIGIRESIKLMYAGSLFSLSYHVALRLGPRNQPAHTAQRQHRIDREDPLHTTITSF